MEMRRFVAKVKKDVVPNLGRKFKNDEEAASQGLVALVLAKFAGMPVELAKEYVIDGGEDFGIDGLYYNSVTRALCLVQSKLRRNQSKTLSQGDALKFVDGVRKLVRGELTTANAKLRRVYPKVEGALEDIDTRIILVVACTSLAALEPNVEAVLQEFCAKQNAIDEAFSFKYISFNELFQAAKLFSPNSNIDVDIRFHPFGVIDQPLKSYFGTVSGEQVAEWVNTFGERLFDQNVRSTLHKSEVNEEILTTIKHQPHNFWYFNNGITAIAAEAAASAAEGPPKKVTVKSMSIVNGAQTAGMLARASNDGLDLSKVQVQVRVRVITLVSAAPGLDEAITKATNTQNQLSPLDFVSLDPHQDLIRSDLAALGYIYSYKRGIESGDVEARIEVKDAAVGLACATSVQLTAQAKRYVSSLWTDIRSTTYLSLFNSSTSGQKVLDAWRVLKLCEAACRDAKNDLEREDALVLTHGDRFVTHCVSELLRRAGGQPTDESISEAATLLISRLLEAYRGNKDKVYPAVDFKSTRFLEEVKALVVT